jgi:hypothetical protein
MAKKAMGENDIFFTINKKTAIVLELRVLNITQ